MRLERQSKCRAEHLDCFEKLFQHSCDDFTSYTHAKAERLSRLKVALTEDSNYLVKFYF